MIRRPRLAALLAAAALTLGATGLGAEDAGRTLFHEGTGAQALLSGGAARVPATLFPCANCHGPDGLGAREGGVAAPPIAWSILSSPTPTRPAYDRAAFEAALTQGTAADGRPLSQAMPRFAMDPATLDALFAYLRRLEAEQQAGIHPDRLNLAGPADPEARAGFEAALRHLGASGRLHGRALAEGRPAALDLSEPFRLLDAATMEAEVEALLAAAASDGVRELALLGPAPDLDLDLDLDLFLRAAGLALQPEASARLLLYPLSPEETLDVETGPIYLRWTALDEALLNRALASPGLTLVVTDPFPDSTAWAREASLGRRAAAGHAATLLAADALLAAGRRLSVSRIAAALAEAVSDEIPVRRFVVPGRVE